MTRRLLFWIAIALVLVSGTALAIRLWTQTNSSPQTTQSSPSSAKSQDPAPPPTSPAPKSAMEILASGQLKPGNAETRLVEVFSLIEQGEFQKALKSAEHITRDHPNFHLAHLVRGDLLRLRYEPSGTLGEQSTLTSEGASARLAALRTETQARLTALRERPPEGYIPHQFLALSSQTKHAIAVDASRSRLYLFVNTTDPTRMQSAAAPSLKLIGDFFISVGKSGINKRVEGDGRTPLGAYYITSIREKKTLPEFYGAGALPINYPNALDVQRGRTGSGIWLHGTPPQQYVRAPLASDGCVVLSNPDMEQLLELVTPKTTPVVIAEQLNWVAPTVVQGDTDAFFQLLLSWQKARSHATPEDFAQILDREAFTKVNLNSKNPSQDLLTSANVQLGLTDLSLLKWQDPNDNMVATFTETVNGQITDVVRRQYWVLRAEGWRLLHDAVLSGVPHPTLKRAVVKQVETPAERQVAAVDDPANKLVTALSKSGPEAQVQQAVQDWAKAWSQKNMAHYLNAYAPSFEPPGGVPRKAWEQERRNRILSKNKINVNLSKWKVHVSGNTATVSFVQNYKADQLAVTSRKTLKLIKKTDQWLITQESVGG